jgi:energy-coupling factor transport system permease protein
MLILNYLKRDSYLEKIPPEFRIFLFTLIAFLIIYFEKFSLLLSIFIFLLLLILISKIGIFLILREIKFFFLVLILIFVIFSFITSFKHSFIISFRIFLFLLTAIIFRITTSVIEFSYGMKKILNPFKRIKFLPIEEFIFVFTLSLKFLPIIAEEFEKIVNAKKAREDISFKDFFSILMPVFYSTLRRSEELTEALKSRCYKIEK